eukprot:2714015-Amphidinium_carterae.2
MDVVAGKASKPKPEEVVLTQKHNLIVERHFLCLTERDMRKETNLARIPKSALKQCNSIVLPTADGKGTETGYLFVNPDMPYRTCRFAVQMESSLAKPLLQAADCCYPDQGTHYQVKGIHDLGEESLGNLVARDQGGHLFTMPWGEFKSSKLQSSLEDEDLVEDDDEEEEEVLIEGVAAAASTHTPTEKKTRRGKSGLLAMNSTSSLDRGQNNKASANCSGTGSMARAGESMAATSVCEDETEALPGLQVIDPHKKDRDTNMEVGLPEDSVGAKKGLNASAEALDHWRQKIDVYKVLEGTVDKRSINGLKQCIKQKLKKDSEKTTAFLLQNFYNLIVALQKLDPENFDQVTDTEAQTIIQELLKEKGEKRLPAGLQYRLVMRRAHVLLSERRIEELVHVLNPFIQVEFDPSNPCIAGMSEESSEKKVSTFRRIVFSDLLGKYILEGEKEASKVCHLCSLGLNMFGDIDELYLDNFAASTLSSTRSIWRAVRALLVPSVDIDVLDCTWGRAASERVE